MKFKCACYAPQKATLESSSAGISCNEEFATFDNQVTVQESYLKIKIMENQLKKSENEQTMKIHFRSRGGKRLEYAADGATESALWIGIKNDSTWRGVNGFKLVESNGAWMAKYEGGTTGKNYDGFMLYGPGPGTGKLMIAACLQNKKNH